MTFYSQIGQDEWVLRTLGGKANGYYVDVGAHNGIEFSNSKTLEELGWTGICIEPSGVFEELQRNRKCICDNSCVVDQDGKQVTFWDGTADLMYSSFVKRPPNATARTLSGLTLTSILKTYDAPKTIDYLSIDVEGAEIEVLKGMDFAAYDVRTITIEHNFNAEHRAAIASILLGNGFVLGQQREWDDWYIKP